MYLVSKLKKCDQTLSLEDIFAADDSFEFDTTPSRNTHDTRTTKVDYLPPKYYSRFRVTQAVKQLKEFNEQTKDLHVEDMSTLYRHFTIPKGSGGRRPIDAPEADLEIALRNLKAMFEGWMPLNYHTAAYAYVKGRCAADVARKHQKAENRWFLHMDFSKFFPSTTKDFVERMFAQIYPFAIIMQSSEGKEELSKALELCFLNGGLPQGTPISPLITNIMMIPIDHDFANCELMLNNKFTYTRYADDTIIGGRMKFDWHEVEKALQEVLKKHEAPFLVNTKKTKFGSSAGRNYILGVILNKDNEISLGSGRRKKLKTAIFSMLADYKAGIRWDVSRTQELQGNVAYFSMVNKEDTDNILKHYGNKMGLSVRDVFRDLLTV